MRLSIGLHGSGYVPCFTIYKAPLTILTLEIYSSCLESITIQVKNENVTMLVNPSVTDILELTNCGLSTLINNSMCINN